MLTIYATIAIAASGWVPAGFPEVISVDWEPWETPEVEWHLPEMAMTDITWLGDQPVVHESQTGLLELLGRNGEWGDLAGEATGHKVLLPNPRLDYQDLVDLERCEYREDLREEFEQARRRHGERRGLPESEWLPIDLPIAKYRFFEDRLVPNSIARAKGIIASFVTIELEDDTVDPTDPARCGLRAWCKHHELSGIYFKKIWDQTDTFDYDWRWEREHTLSGYNDWD